MEYNQKDLIHELCSMIHGRALQKNLKFEIDVDEMLPTRLLGDEAKIKQIVLNLLTNAVKYTEEGKVVLKVSLEAKNGEEFLIRYEVHDTGIGVREEDIDKVFNAYERLDEEKNYGIQGTGLGLDISRQFTELMGGNIWCESVYGEGSEFIFTVTQKVIDRKPIGVYKEEDETLVGRPYVPQFIAPDAEILVVDDNPMNLMVIKNLLKSTKMLVATAESGEECLEKLRYSNFDIVLLDHMMPGLDGVETCRRIRENYPNLPVYALTANAAAGEEYYLENGFDGYLAKPIDSRLLEQVIMQHLPE
jgi:CheY-like chemotaxis protein